MRLFFVSVQALQLRLERIAGISFAESLSGQLTKEDPAATRLYFFVSSKPLKASFTAFSETKKPG